MDSDENAPLGVILAGGRGERIRGVNAVEKPLAMVNGTPIALHIAHALGRAGTRRVVILTGQNHESVVHGLSLSRTSGLLIDNGEPVVEIELRFSGNDAGTAGRLLALTPHELRNGALVSYTDILTDANLALLKSGLEQHKAECSILAVNPREPWGKLEIDHGRVTQFMEKEVNKGMWINGGVFAVSPRIQDYIHHEHEMLELEPMQRLIAASAVSAEQFSGWWACIDTPKDLKLVNSSSEARARLSRNLSVCCAGQHRTITTHAESREEC